MARFKRLTVLQGLIEVGLLPLFYHEDCEIVRASVHACERAGCRVFEFTNRGDFAWQTFAEVEKTLRAEKSAVMLGAGSIVEPETAALYINCGASFIVGPNFNPHIATLCNRRKVAYLPGCGSASEISIAEEAGCEMVKIFPAKELGGPDFVKAIKGPMPWATLLATGGVDLDEQSLAAWFSAGVSSVGLGSALFTADAIAKKDFTAITSRVAKAIELINKARSTH